MKSIAKKIVALGVLTAALGLSANVFASDRFPLPHEILGIPTPHELLGIPDKPRGFLKRHRVDHAVDEAYPKDLSAISQF